MKKAKIFAKRCLVTVLCVATMLTCMPVSVFADETLDEPVATETVVETTVSEEPVEIIEETPVVAATEPILEEVITEEEPSEVITEEEPAIEIMEETPEIKEETPEIIEEKPEEEISEEPIDVIDEENPEEVVLEDIEEELPLELENELEEEKPMMLMSAKGKSYGPLKFNVTKVCEPAEGGTINGPDQYEYTSFPPYPSWTAYPNEGYKLVSFTVDGEEKLNGFPVRVYGNVTVKAVFEKLPEYSITKEVNPSSECGSVEVNNVAKANDSVSFLATANKGYDYKKTDVIKEDGSLLKSFTSASGSFNMPSCNVTVKSYFEAKTYFISKSSNIMNGCTIDAPSSAKYGEQINISVTPKDGYEVVSVKANNTIINPSEPYTVTGNTTISVELKRLYKPTISKQCRPAGGGTIEGIGNTATGGEVVPIEFKATNGYVFKKATIKYGNHTINVKSANYDFAVPETNNNISIIAEFESLPSYYVAASVSPIDNGSYTISKTLITEGDTTTINFKARDGYEFKYAEYEFDGEKVRSYNPEVTITALKGFKNNSIYVVGYFDKKPEWTIVATVYPSEGGTVTNNGKTLYEGATGRVEFEPYPGYVFDHMEWTYDGKPMRSDTPSLTVTAEEGYANHTIAIKGYFKKKVWTVVGNCNPSEGGYLNKDGLELNEGEEAIVEFKANDGYKFDHMEWTIGGNTLKAYSRTLKVTASDEWADNKIELKGFFTKIEPWTVIATIDPAEGGTVIGNGKEYYEGESGYVTFQPNDGYVFDHMEWTKYGKTTTVYTPTLKFTVSSNIWPNHQIKIKGYFKKNVWTVVGNCDPSEGGYLNKDGLELKEGEDAIVEFKANDGYKFDHMEWTIGGNTLTAYSPTLKVTASDDWADNTIELKGYFRRLEKHNVTLKVNYDECDATVSKDSYLEGETFNVDVMAANGYKFKDYGLSDGHYDDINHEFTMGNRDMFIYVNFEKNAYSIMKEIADGDGTIDAPTQSEWGNEINVSCKASDGYKFTKAELVYNGEVQKTYTNPSFTFEMPKYDVTIKAMFEKIPTEPEYVTLTFMPGEGKGEKKDVKVEKGKEYTFPENFYGKPNNPKKVFDGWKIADTIYKPGETFIPTKDVNVLCWWVIKKDPEPVKYTVSFDANGGEGIMESFTVDEGTKIDVPECKFTRSGYHFTYWTVDEIKISSDKYEVTKDVTFVANWEKDDPIIPPPDAYYEVRYYSNNGSAQTYADENIPEGSKYEIKDCMFTYDGYTFAGWINEDKEPVEVGKMVEVNRNYILIATWKKDDPIVPPTPSNYYNVTYYANNGTSLKYSDSNILEGTSYEIKSNMFAYDGYTFAGWVNSENKAVAVGSKVVVNSDIKLIATWEKISKPEPPKDDDPKPVEPKDDPKPDDTPVIDAPKVEAPQTQITAPEPVNTEKPQQPKLPQTGGLLYNAAVLISLGLGLVVVGLIIFFTRKKK